MPNRSSTGLSKPECQLVSLPQRGILDSQNSSNMSHFSFHSIQFSGLSIYSVMHATPSALYAHVPNRRWECETKMTADDIKRGCKDIARQMVENEPGKNINVIMGGGRQCLVSHVSGTDDDPIDEWSCSAADGRNLINDWQNDKRERQLRYAAVENNEQLNNINVDNTDYVLGMNNNPNRSTTTNQPNNNDNNDRLLDESTIYYFNRFCCIFFIQLLELTVTRL